MRISDLSSDVCSSDLERPGLGEDQRRIRSATGAAGERVAVGGSAERVSARHPASAEYRGSEDFGGPRSEERRVGNECVRTCRSRCSRVHKTKKQIDTTSSDSFTNKQNPYKINT